MPALEHFFLRVMNIISRAHPWVHGRLVGGPRGRLVGGPRGRLGGGPLGRLGGGPQGRVQILNYLARLRSEV